MIIYGSKAKELAKETSSEKCPNCGSQHSVEMHVFQKYAHVFWIPFLPMGKTGVSECLNCKQVLKLKEMPPALKLSYENLKPQTKTPIWTFSGLAVVAVLIVLGVVSEQKKDAKNAKLIITPQKGDVFEIKNGAAQYTLYKIDDVKGDTVLMLLNNFAANKSSGLNEIKSKGDSEYSDEILPLTKSDLKRMLDNGEILDIERR